MTKFRKGDVVRVCGYDRKRIFTAFAINARRGRIFSTIDSLSARLGEFVTFDPEYDVLLYRRPARRPGALK